MESACSIYELNIMPGRGWYLQKNWVGVRGPLRKTLTPFMTKICDFPYPDYDMKKTSVPYLWLLWLA